MISPESVPLGLLRRYLEALGWSRLAAAGVEPSTPDQGARPAVEAERFFKSRSFGPRNVDIFVNPASDLKDIELIVPRDGSGSDYASRLLDVVVALSGIEEIRPDQVAVAIRSIGYDLVQSRVPDSLVSDDSIDLERAKAFINGVKDLLAATATSELRPLPFYGRANKDAIVYSDRCRFGHTYRGSFGFTIESPVVPKKQSNLFGLEPPAPFERRVVQRLALGIQRLSDSVRIDDPKPVIEGFRQGFSANACEQFATLIHQTAYSGMTLDFTFSPEWTLPSELKRHTEFFVGPRHVEMARAAANSLRGESLELLIDVSGMVVRLQNESDPSDLLARTGEGEIAVLYSSELYGDIHVRIPLSPIEYIKAVEAHRLGRPVRVTGTLVHRGRYWYLRDPSPLTVPHQSDLDLE